MSSATQHAMLPEFGGKWGIFSLSIRGILTLVPSAYPATCEIQREADFYKYTYLSKSREYPVLQFSILLFPPTPHSTLQFTYKIKIINLKYLQLLE